MIRVAVIGAGHWGPNLIRNFNTKERSETAWVVDRDPSRLAAVAARNPGVRTATDPRSVWEDTTVDAVVIATPSSTHFDLGKAAIESGKHVLIEKPLATTSADARSLCELAERHGKILMVGHVFVFNPGVRAVKAYLDADELGRVYFVSMVRTNLGPIRTDVSAAWDLAAHDISIVNYWLGTKPQTASAVGGTWINPGIEDAVFATLRYPGDVLVNLHVSWLNPRKARDITVVGERRMLTFDDMNLSEPLRLYDKRVVDNADKGYADTFASFRSSVRDGDIVIPRVALGEPLRSECEHFLECVASGGAPVTDGLSGVAVVNVLEAIARSIANHGREEEVAS